MKEYFLSIVAFILICSILTKVLPHGKTKPLLLGAIRLACLSMILVPVGSLFQPEKSVVEIDQAFLEYCSDYVRETFNQKIKDELFDAYSDRVEVCSKWDLVKLIKIELVFDMNGRIVHMNREKSVAEELKKQYGVEVSYETSSG